MYTKRFVVDTWKEAIIDLLEKGKRIDGRKLDEYRKIEVNINPFENAEGSAIVKLGDTIVATGVKIDIGEPFPDTPNLGIQIVGAELTPLADESFEPGPPGPEAIELARVVDRSLREGEVIDLEKLAIKEGEKVWKIFIDIYVYNNDGNLYDASYLSSLLALKNAYLPKIEDDKVLYGEKSDTKIPIKNPNVYQVTLAKIDEYIIVDPNKIEEEVADVILHVGTDGDYIYSLQKRGVGLLKEEEFINMIEISKDIVNNYFKKEKWVLKEKLLL